MTRMRRLKAYGTCQCKVPWATFEENHRYLFKQYSGGRIVVTGTLPNGESHDYALSNGLFKQHYEYVANTVVFISSHGTLSGPGIEGTI